MLGIKTTILALLLTLAQASILPSQAYNQPAAVQNMEQHSLEQQQYHDDHHQQTPLSSSQPSSLGVGHFSEWSRETKKRFLIDWQAGREAEWSIVQGNEAGDLDSMTAALTWAYHLEHSTANNSTPRKVIALLQTQTHALDLRPENQLALRRSRMTRGHQDLLTMDELPEDPETLGPKLQGIVLVDHAAPKRNWRGAKVLSIFDHHMDIGFAPDAEPRVFEKAASCTTLVARQMLDELEALPEEYHMPHELIELMLSAIAIDSGALKGKKTTDADVAVAKRLLKRSTKWADKKLKHVMNDLNNDLTEAQKDIGDLGLRDLLRRDWKGDVIDTPSPRTPTVSLGFASVPFSMDDQIQKTDFQELFHWFAVEAAWTAEVGVDLSVVLSKYKIRTEGKKKKKVRELTLIVRDDVTINREQADSLFRAVKKALEESDELELEPWHRADDLGPRQMVWVNKANAGRKVVRPVVEKAIMNWDRI